MLHLLDFCYFRGNVVPKCDFQALPGLAKTHQVFRKNPKRKIHLKRNDTLLQNIWSIIIFCEVVNGVTFLVLKRNVNCTFYRNDGNAYILKQNTIAFKGILNIVFSQKESCAFCSTLWGLKYKPLAPKGGKVPARSDLDNLFKAKMEVFRGSSRIQWLSTCRNIALANSFHCFRDKKSGHRLFQKRWYSLQIIGDFGWLAATATIFIQIPMDSYRSQ